ncbi:helix-turn-helix domain-containing protein [Actinokineospora spheciospongiae]|uniref:helix-turn-helix domain-containing protein n=1 Tax=Actinokineospora spheciospongiae TaxID=909613 RepID=UPI001C643C02|nr:helix-turn-helix transcriptional regulator [Actinokineospora spheciospongiae]
MTGSPGLLLRRARRRRGMSQTMLADRAGYTVSYISMIENGRRPLDHLPTVRTLAAALNVPVVELVPWLVDGTAAQPCRCQNLPVLRLDVHL